MVLVILQIRSGVKVLKPWYGCLVPDQGTLADLFQNYASGVFDNSQPLPEYLNADISCSVGKSKLISMSASVTVGVAVLWEWLCVLWDVSKCYWWEWLCVLWDAVLHSM